MAEDVGLVEVVNDRQKMSNHQSVAILGGP